MSRTSSLTTERLAFFVKTTTLLSFCGQNDLINFTFILSTETDHGDEYCLWKRNSFRLLTVWLTKKVNENTVVYKFYIPLATKNIHPWKVKKKMMQRRLPAFMSHSIQSDSLPGDDNSEQRLDLTLFWEGWGEGWIWNFQGLE